MNRPLTRSIIKLATRAVLGGSRAHVQDWFPYLKLERPGSAEEPGRILYRHRPVGQLVHPDLLRTLSGKEIIIVGTGPSVRQVDFSRIGPRTAILLNGAINLIGSEVKEPLAVAVEDERLVWRHPAFLRDKVPLDTVCLLSVSVMRALCEVDASWLTGRTIILIDDIRKPYGGKRRRSADLAGLDHVRLDADAVAGVSSDPARGVFQGGSVVVSALQFALFCNPERIGLSGIDISNADRPRFYEKADKAWKSGVPKAKERILTHVALAKTVCEERGIELLNFSPVSALQEIGLPYDPRYGRDAGAE